MVLNFLKLRFNIRQALKINFYAGEDSRGYLAGNDFKKP